MGKISEFDGVLHLCDAVSEKLESARSLESASGLLLDLLFEEFAESLLLARVFATVPYGQLPIENREFVDRLTESRGVERTADDTPVLSLTATRGVRPEWNDRRKSSGHVGIPLLSSEFVDTVPMLARLLVEVGLKLEWLDNRGSGIDFHTLDRRSSVFHVEDARTAVDGHGRKIISAEDFVDAYDVRTVFGLAGGYSISRTFVTILLFCRETVPRERAMSFMPLMSTMKASVANVVSRAAIFDD